MGVAARVARYCAGVVAVATILLASPSLANGVHGFPSGSEPATRFEAFVAVDCSPCVKDAYPVSRVGTSSLRLPGFGPQPAGTASRPGEIRLEIVRAYPLGRVGQQFLALRITLFVATGGGQLFRFVTGLVDEEDVPAMSAAVAAMVKHFEGQPKEPSPELTEVEFHRGSIRVGSIRVQGGGDIGAYLQAGDIRTLAPPTSLETPSTLFFPSTDLVVLGNVLGRVPAAMRQLRGQ
jgi:hypothetical protein